MAERAYDRDRLAFATFADRRRPDGELQVGRDIARPRLSERDLDLAGFRVSRRRGALELPHAADDTSRPLTPSSPIRPSPKTRPHLRKDPHLDDGERRRMTERGGRGPQPHRRENVEP